MTKSMKRMTREDVKTVTDELHNLPVKEKNEFSAREYVQMNKDKILEAINTKGYSLQDIVDLLAEHSVQISASTLASYLRTASPKKPNARGARKAPRAAQTKDSAQTDVAQKPDGIQNAKTSPTEPKKLSERLPTFENAYNDGQ